MKSLWTTAFRFNHLFAKLLQGRPSATRSAMSTFRQPATLRELPKMPLARSSRYEGSGHNRGFKYQAALSASPGLLLLAAPVFASQAHCARDTVYPEPGDFVVVHIWRPEGTAARALFGGDTGHVALSVYRKGKREAYISFWPTGEGKKADGSKGEFVSLETDLDPKKGEGRVPDVDIVLYGLDTWEMTDFYDVTKDRYIKWVATKDIPGDTRHDTKQNCATIAWRTLLAGGIKQYYRPDKKGATDPNLQRKYHCNPARTDGWGIRNWIVTPVLIQHLAVSAKEQEMRKFPQTKSWSAALNYPTLTGGGQAPNRIKRKKL